MPRARIDFSLGKSASIKLRPNSSMEHRGSRARVRAFEPQAQLAGSVANSASAIWLRDPHTLQMNSIMQALLWHGRTRPQAGVGRLKPAPPMQAIDPPLVGQAVSPADYISSQVFSGSDAALDLGQEFRFALNPHADFQPVKRQRRRPRP